MNSKKIKRSSLVGTKQEFAKKNPNVVIVYEFKKKEADVGQRHQLIISYSENAGAVRAIPE